MSHTERTDKDNLGPLSSDRSRTKWTSTMDRYFIDVMLEQVHKGCKVGNTFQKKAWEDMVTLLNEKFGLQLDKEILRNRSKKLRLQYKSVKTLLDQCGFHWDETQKIVTADDSIWDDYLKGHPEVQPYRTKIVPNYNDLSMIYGKETSDGRYNHSGDNTKLTDNIPEMKVVGLLTDPQSPSKSVGHEDLSVVRFSQFEEGMDKKTLVSSDCLRTNWTPTMDRYFIDIMMEQVHRGYKNGTIFRKKAWLNMVILFNTKFGLKLDKEVLRNRHKKLRLQYNAMKILLDNNGFHWDETRQMVTADDHIWDNYLKAHPEARSYRTKTVPNYKDLCVIYGNETANGSNRSGHNVNLAIVPAMKIDGGGDNLNLAIVPAMKIDGGSGGSQSPCASAAHGDPCVVRSSQFVEGTDNQDPPSTDRLKTNWTPPMDRYFIDVMIDQVHQGSKIGNTFRKEAWAHIITVFNTKFGLNLDREALRNRYRKLKMQYNAMKSLLDNNGFHWDETRQMITADDCVWDDYLKVHPEVRAYRTKTVPNYNDLCIIYGNLATAGRFSHSGHDLDPGNIPGTEIGALEGPHSPTMFAAHGDPDLDTHESSSHTNEQSKRPFETPSTSQHSRKTQKSTDEGMVDALREMAFAITSLANMKKENDISITLENMVKALKAIPDIDEDLFLDACDLLEDEKKAKMFLALDAAIRKKWLLRKLRP